MKNKMTKLSVLLLVGLVGFGVIIISANPFNFATSPLAHLLGHNGLFPSNTVHPPSSSGTSLVGNQNNVGGNSSGISSTPTGGNSQHHHSDDDGSFGGFDG